ncbi:hypothetical protein FK529_12010 [Tsukamurella asaccharolytica]|uniref:Uncharacterized protein n=1 Tax=Tsukamurella asaccharolytica TaxID=2592067 RepID=A0A5C5R809_9ACTN|nr:hypothetical protein [Tsukamurella asaccharolytica]TWS19229.1 hypothetical protein FK529_12010 [Tsukamurella asaccharolytica]
MDGDSRTPGRAQYDAEDRRDRYWAGPVMPARQRAFNRRASEACLRLMAARRTANISFTDLAEATGDISSRTLRRHFPTVAAAAYWTAWWLPGAAHSVRWVLAPRERVGPCWPTEVDDPVVAAVSAIDPDDDHFDWPPAEFFESRGIPDPLNPGAVSPHPITLTDFFVDLRILDRSWGRRTGYAAIAEPLAALRGEFPELDAWYQRAMHRRGESLGPLLSRAFGMAEARARAAGYAYSGLEWRSDRSAFRCGPRPRATGRSVSPGTRR